MIAPVMTQEDPAVKVIAQWRGREPYFWYQVQHATYGTGWIYGQFLRFDDEKSMFPQVHLLVRNIDDRYGLGVDDTVRKLGTPTRHDQKTGRLDPFETSYISNRLQYPGITLRFLRYFEQDHLFEIETTSAAYPMGNLLVGMHKTDVMLELGKGVATKTNQGEVIAYIDPVTARAKITFTFNADGRLTHIKKIAWID